MCSTLRTLFPQLGSPPWTSPGTSGTSPSSSCWPRPRRLPPRHPCRPRKVPFVPHHCAPPPPLRATPPCRRCGATWPHSTVFKNRQTFHRGHCLLIPFPRLHGGGKAMCVLGSRNVVWRQYIDVTEFQTETPLTLPKFLILAPYFKMGNVGHFATL